MGIEIYILKISKTLSEMGKNAIEFPYELICAGKNFWLEHRMCWIKDRSLIGLNEMRVLSLTYTRIYEENF